MRALITGGAGFIGSNIVSQLLKMNHEVVILDNFSSGYEINILKGVKVVKGDIRNDKDIKEAVKGCEVIFNLAASVGNKRSIDNPLEDSDINVIGVLNILEIAKKNGIKVVHSSSAGIFGELKQLPINEDHQQNPNSPYGISKLAAEKYCLIYNDLFNMKNVCLRYFNVYGVNQRYDAYGNVIPIFAARTLKKLPILIYGDGNQTRDFINVYDVAMANISCAFSENAKGVYNLGSGKSITINNLAKMMINESGIDVEMKYLEPRKGDVRDSLANIEKINKDINFSPKVEFKDGLKEYYEWIKKDTLLPLMLNKI